MFELGEDRRLISHYSVTHITYGLAGIADYPSMALGFNVMRKLEDGEVLAITWREQLSEAQSIARELAECWPGEYLIEEATGAPGPWVPYMFAASSWPN